MRRTYWYAAMTEDAAQRSRWAFYEVVNLHGIYYTSTSAADTLPFLIKTVELAG